jgi:hypothetical protein
MSNPEEANEHKWYHSPESNFYITPLEPYTARFIQFAALQQLGYPVEIQQLSVDEVPDWADDWCEWEKTQYPAWFRPITLNQDFDKFIDATDCPGDAFRSDEGLDDRLFHHPVQVVHLVDDADIGTLSRDLSRIEADQTSRWIQVPEDMDISLEEILKRSILASFGRWLGLFQEGAPFSEYRLPSADDMTLYGELKRDGVKPYSPEDMLGFMLHYYETVEKLYPEFAAHKTKPHHA